MKPEIFPSNDEFIEILSGHDAVLKCDATGFPSVSKAFLHNKVKQGI